MVPVTIIAGFLGAGKTSLLNHLLAHADGRRIAVLVNDFGAINIDAELIQNRSGEVISLENGCICCSLSEGLLASVAMVMRRSEPPEQIVVETSGISDPVEIARTLSDPELQRFAPLESVVTVVDAETATQLTGESQRMAVHQIGAADLVLINKADLATSEAKEATAAWVRRHSPGVRILETTHARVPPTVIFGTFGKSLEDRLSAGRGYHHGEDFESFTYETDDPISMQRLHAVLQALPPMVLRAKGILYLHERRSHRCILQSTGKRAILTVGAPWNETVPSSRIVFIGIRGGLELEWLQHALAATRANPPDDADS